MKPNIKTTTLKAAVLSIGLVLILPIISSIGSYTEQRQIENSSTPPDVITGTPPGWSEDVRLTFAPSVSEDVDIATDGEYIYIVWGDYRGPSYEIYFKKSEDGGLTWSSDLQISTGPVGFGYPRIAVNGSHIHVVWEGLDLTREVHYRNSTDGGETWNAEVRLTADDGNQSYNSDICVVGDNIHVVWDDKRDYPEPELYYRNSTDGGATWNPPQRLTYYADADGGASIQANGSKIHITWARWLTKNEMFYMNSGDGGITWSPEQQLTPNDGVETGPWALAVWQDNLHIVYRDAIEGSDEVYYLNSTNGGTSWNPSRRISDLPDYSSVADIAVEENNVSVVWADTRDLYGTVGTPTEIYFANSTDGGTTWSSNIRLTYAENASNKPALDVENGRIHVVWIDNRETGTLAGLEIYYKRYPDFPDLSPPDHTNELPPPDSYRDAPGTNISVHVTDPSGVNESTIQLFVNGSLISHILTPITDGYNVSYESPGFDPGVVICRIVVDDNCSNTLDFTWNFTVLALYEIPLQKGWNLISVPHVQVDTAIDEVLKDIDGKWNYIQWYDPIDPDHWKTYATFKPESLNDLFEINRTIAIWINITEPNVNLTVRGHISTLTEIPLYAGWNLVGYPTQTTETVANALWGTGATRVAVFDALAPYRISEVGPTYVMKPGEGYWVKVPANSVWVVDW